MVASSLVELGLDPFEDITDLQKFSKNIEIAINMAAEQMQMQIPSGKAFPFMNSSNTDHVSAADAVRQGIVEALSGTLDSSSEDEDYDRRDLSVSLAQTDTDLDAACLGGPIRPSASSLVPAFHHFFSLVKTGIEDYRDEFVNGPAETTDSYSNFDYRNPQSPRHNKDRFPSQYDDTRDDDISVDHHSKFSISEILPKLRPPTTKSKGRDDILIASSTVSDISESDDDSSLGSLSTQSSADEGDKKAESKPYMNIIFDKGNQVLNLVKKGNIARKVQDPDGEKKSNEEEEQAVVSEPKTDEPLLAAVVSQPETVKPLPASEEKHDPIPNAPTPKDAAPKDESAQSLFYHSKEFPTEAKDIMDQFGAKSMSEFTEEEIADLILLMLRKKMANKKNEKNVASTETHDNNNVATTQSDPVDIASPEDFEHAMMGNLILSSLAEVAEQKDASIVKSSSAQSEKVDLEILRTVTEATTASEGCIENKGSEGCIATKTSERYIESKPSEGSNVNKSKENDNAAKKGEGQEILIYTMPSKYVEEDVANEHQMDVYSNSNQIRITEDYAEDYRTFESPVIYSGALSCPLTPRSKFWKLDPRRSATVRLLKAIRRSIGRSRRPEKKKKFFDSNSTVGGSTTRGRRGTTASLRRIRRLRKKVPKKEEDEENPEEDAEALLLAF